MLAQTAYLPLWFMKSRVFGKKAPLQTVLFITDHCNLRCKHCTPSGHGCTQVKHYEQIKEELAYSYRLGSRFVDFEGGEPTLWRDGERTLNDLYRLAKDMGFFSCTLTTNGQRPFGDTLADSVWVSVDGYQDYHDWIRGPGTFARLDGNISASGHPALSVSMAVNRLNRPSLADTVRYAQANPAIRSIALNLHTPFPDTDGLTMSWAERCQVIDEVIALKQGGAPIMNSLSGLKVMKKRGFPKDCWMANYILVDGTRLECCPGSRLGVCDDCGFCMSGEMYSVLRLRPDTLRAGMDLRMT